MKTIAVIFGGKSAEHDVSIVTAIASVIKPLELSKKYRVEAVPIVVVADAAGVARASFIGPTSATDLWAAVAEVRAPGSSPEPELGQR